MTFQIWNDLRSETLDSRTTLSVITPEGNDDAPVSWPDQTPGLLILLHGLTGNNAIWPQRTDLTRLANRHNVVIAMPDGVRSFWVDQAYGLPYGRWVGEELPQILRSTLRISRERDRTYIGGLSMGGYGAFRAAFDYPQTFAGAVSLSGTLDVAEEAFRGRHLDLYEIGFGNENTPRPQDDLVRRLKETPLDCPRNVRLFACCGTGDRLLGQNQRFVEAANEANMDITWDEGPGTHSFAFWNEWLPKGLDAVIR